jgi:recombinational DNA repair protein (RecF pathway)
MFHHTYNSPAFVLGSTPAGESSRFVFLFTKELGLVGAHAQNTRHVSSKLRYSLNAPARSVVSLVRGKSTWRLTNAMPDKGFYFIFKEQPEKQKLCTRIFSLIKKLLAGEESNPELFTLVDNFLIFLEETELGGEELKNIEAVVMLRILYMLGYIPQNELSQEFTNNFDWKKEILERMGPQRKEAVRMINESLRATGL